MIHSNTNWTQWKGFERFIKMRIELALDEKGKNHRYHVFAEVRHVSLIENPLTQHRCDLSIMTDFADTSMSRQISSDQRI